MAFQPSLANEPAKKPAGRPRLDPAEIGRGAPGDATAGFDHPKHELFLLPELGRGPPDIPPELPGLPMNGRRKLEGASLPRPPGFDEAVLDQRFQRGLRFRRRLLMSRPASGMVIRRDARNRLRIKSPSSVGGRPFCPS